MRTSGVNEAGQSPSLDTDDHLPDREVAVWIALRRVHQGGVGYLDGLWLDSGRPVPSYVAGALDGPWRPSRELHLVP